MSYILDALKRSEQERHQGELTPTTIDTIMYKPRPVKHQWWPYLLIFILLVNLGVYLYFQLTRNESGTNENAKAGQIEFDKASTNTGNQRELIHQEVLSDAQRPLSSKQNSDNKTALPSTSIKTPPNAADSAVKALPEHLFQTPNLNKFYEMNQVQSNADVKKEYAENQRASISQTLKSEPAAEFNEDGFEVIRPKNVSGSTVVLPETKVSDKSETVQGAFQAIPENYELIEPSKDVTNTQAKLNDTHTQALSANKSNDLENVPHLSDLPGAFQSNVPDIRFNSHIYSDQPAERRVMINDLYLKEGESFSGMRIETIGEFYIELEKQGQHFKLPVLRDWFSPR